LRDEIRALLHRDQTWHGELLCRRKNGEDYIVRSSMTPLRDERGVMRHCIAIKEDITQQKKEQERQRQLELQLVQAQRMESIGTLAGGIAHDFNNILTGILGFTELAEGSVEAEHEAHECLGEIRRAGTRAKELVAQLLTFSRQKETSQVPLDLARVVGEAVKFIRASLPTTIEIERKLIPGKIRADPTQIHQVVMNLCTNAMHAMRDRPGLLSVQVEPLQVDDALAAAVPDLAPGAYLRLTVRDTGHGIDAANVRRIFDPFYTTKKIGEGTGLGLALVQSIVTAHRGAIRVSSVVGQGTAFEIFLPACEEHEPPSAPAEPVVPGQGEHVLLVDDEVSVGTFARVRLEQLNYRVTVFTDPRRALAAVRKDPGRFAVLFTDYTMPGLTGLDLMREIRNAGLQLPAVIATGNRSAISASALAEFPQALLIEKPFTGEILAQALHAILHPVGTGTPNK
jgi:signal transduction histidine kinase